MTNFYPLLGLYYFAAIVGFLLHRYFSKFIASDFQNNRTLNIKRRLTIIYYYGTAIAGGIFVKFIGNNSTQIEENIFTLSIIPSIAIILLCYFYLMVSLESPKKFHKKRKWK